MCKFTKLLQIPCNLLIFYHIQNNLRNTMKKKPNWNLERPDWDTHFMLQAEIAKLRSNCLTRQIGSVIVKNNRQISSGYNGTPPGIKNCTEGGCERCLGRLKGKVQSGVGLERCLCTHAEANAIMQCALFGNSGNTRDATIYSTFVPCLECSKMIISVGIKRVVALYEYPEDGQTILRQANIQLDILKKAGLLPWINVLKSSMINDNVKNNYI